LWPPPITTTSYFDPPDPLPTAIILSTPAQLWFQQPAGPFGAMKFGTGDDLKVTPHSILDLLNCRDLVSKYD
jgi:hypothetical protein